jgi:hypothetical protein
MVIYESAAYEFGALGRAEYFVPQHLAPEPVAGADR